MPEISDFWLKINYWSITHLKELKKWWVIVFLAVDIFIAVFALTNTIIYLLTMERDTGLVRDMASNVVDYSGYHQRISPQDIEVQNAVALSQGSKKYDLLAMINNPNANWAVTSLSFVFTSSAGETKESSSFLMPNESKYLTFLGQTYEKPPSDLKLEIRNIKWQRIKDMASFPVLDFKIENLQIIPLSTSTGENVLKVTADVANASIYGFWQAKFAVILKSGDQVVGINYVTLNEFKAFEKKILISQRSNVQSVTSAEIKPEINLTDQGNFIK